VRQNQERHILEHMAAYGITDKVKGTQSFLKTEQSRDWRLTIQDVLNMKADLDKKMWRFHPNQQQSIRMWTQQHPEDVLLYEEQQPLRGTPDYEYYTADQDPTEATTGSSVERSTTTTGFPFFSDPEHTLEVQANSVAEEALAEESTENDRVPAAIESGNSNSIWLPEAPDLPRSQAATADVYRNGKKVFTYDANNWTDFNLAFTTQFGIEAALKYGHERPLIMDSTFGTNNLKFPLTTVMVVDDHNNGIPVAWLMSSSESIESVSKFLTAFRSRV